VNTRRIFIGVASGVALGVLLAPSTFARGASQLPVGEGSAPKNTPDAKPANATPRGKKLKILVLGGTGFLGPQIVNRAIENGHEVTLFNRGKTSPGLFPDVEHIEGDRYTDLSGLKTAVEAGRKWDAVIDTFTYVPKTVTDVMDILRPAMDQFVVISTISVYASSDEVDANEDAALATIPDEVAAGITTHQQVGAHYGAMKARVEKAAEAHSPGTVTVIRPGLIVGPRDTTGRYTYWPVRGSEGGRMIAPGTGDDFLQIVDVRDLGDFTVECVEKKHFGVFNAVNPPRTLTMRKVVDSVCRQGGAESKPVWIPAEFLAANGVQAWQHMPAWVANSTPGYAGFGNINTDRAVKAGLKTRDLDDTNKATLDYFMTRAKELAAERGEEFAQQWRKNTRGGLAPEKEVEVLKAWDERPS